MQKQGSSERSAFLLSLLHQVHLVVLEFDMDVNKLFEEQDSVAIVVDLMLSLWDV